MGKKKKLTDLKRDLQTINKKGLGNLKGGNNGKKSKRWSTCGGLVPQ